jgi:hypothetical protein
MAISGKGEGKAKGAAKDTPRVPRARGRLDWSMICIATTTPDRNAIGSDPEGLRVALLRMFTLGLGWDKFYDSEIANQAGGNIVVARNFRFNTR